MTTTSKAEIIARIMEIGVIPVIRAESAELAQRAAAAIRAGGIPILEITMTVPGALEIIRGLIRECGDNTLIGAGTVLNKNSARDCLAAGARFIVSPALNLDTIAYCKNENVIVMPGALTPSEIVNAWEAGADFVKVFPVSAVGGPAYIRSLKAPLPDVKLVPTGGVTLANAGAYIEAGAEAVGVGGELVDLNALREKKDDLLTERAQQILDNVKHARISRKNSTARQRTGGSGGNA
jgi:2-dehydro-3-deoxyphosphogluconate aldolase / (4S)-4-hydroxy-2-oxoglutarate aldolase